MEETKEESQFLRLIEARKRIQETTVKSRIQIIKFLDNLKQLSEELSHFKITPSTYKERFNRARSKLDHSFLEKTQRMMLYDISREASGIVPLHDFIIRGCILRSIRNWQLTHDQPVMVLTKMNQTDRFRAGAEIINHAKNTISAALYISNKKEKKFLLDKMYQIMLERYEEFLSLQSLVDNPDIQDHFIDSNEIRKETY
ncbi:MAG: hypothetical protein ACXADY_19865 [Candidatus Hodarchaeales archaeon]|jgi:hypothetical protein